MKLTGLLLLVLILLGCGPNQEQSVIQEKRDSIIKLPPGALLPEYEKRKRFWEFINNNGNLMDNKSLASWFSKFRTNYYPQETARFNNYGEQAYLYYSINEELIHPQQISNRKWFRLLVNPSFEMPFVITLEKEFDFYRLTYKLLGKTYSSIPDRVLFSYSDQSFDTTRYNRFFTKLNDKNFMVKKESGKRTQIMHPISFIFEAIDNNQYNRFERINPWLSDFGTKDDYRFMKDALQLISSNSTIYPALKKLYPPDGNERTDNPYEFIENLTME